MSLKRITVSVLIGCVLAFTQACGDSTAKPPESQKLEPVKASEFTISEPQSGSTVDVNAISVKGTGAQPGDIIRIEVFTNEWYLQDGKYDINPDGTWTYAPCYLRGRGNFRLHHSIKASLIRGGQMVAFDTVEEIKAPEPGA